MITDQELADAIRAKFAVAGDAKLGDHARLGVLIAVFCDEHPAWQPTTGGTAVDVYGRDVHIVGPHPFYPGDWIVADAEDGEIVIVGVKELTPKAAG